MAARPHVKRGGDRITLRSPALWLSGVFLNEFLGRVDGLGHAFASLLDYAGRHTLDALGNRFRLFPYALGCNRKDTLFPRREPPARLFPAGGLPSSASALPG